MNYPEILNSMFPVFMLRLALAGLLGALIGLEREYRAKEAGIRTNFLVATGSALIMIASQWGFTDLAALQLKVDGSRVAAQIVSGIGFIGAGTIMMHKHSVHGLTTAAGIWTVAGIGLAAGCGLYFIACAGTALVLIGLEVLHFCTRNVKVKNIQLVFKTKNPECIAAVTDELATLDYKIIRYSVDTGKENYKVNLYLRTHNELHDEKHLLDGMAKYKDAIVEKLESC